MIKRENIFRSFLLLMSMSLFFSCKKNEDRKHSWLHSYNSKSKEPYGTKIAFDHLKYLFPEATIVNKLNTVSTFSTIFSKKSTPRLEAYIGQVFLTSEEDIETIESFLEEGNVLFISTNVIDSNLMHFLEITDIQNPRIGLNFLENTNDFKDFYNQNIYLRKDTSENCFTFYGEELSGNASVDTTDNLRILGTDENGNVNFIMKKFVHGKIFLHLAPQCFTNHFLVQNENLAYLEQCLSFITPDIKTLNWYSFPTRMPQGEAPSKLRVIWNNPMLRAAFLIALFGLLIFVFINAKRRQAIIPIVKPNTNDSMEFAETVGLLYFNKRDNADLCYKIAKYFLEHLRNKYQLNTSLLDKSLEDKLCIKSGCSASDAAEVLYNTKLAQQYLLTSDEELHTYYKLTKKFE